MLRLMRGKERVSVVSDQYGSPTWTKTVCKVIGNLVDQDADSGGIYHVTNRGETSWFEFARAIYSIALEQGLLSRECDIVPIATDEYPTRAVRPVHSALSCDKIAKHLGVELPVWRESLLSFMAHERPL
jgi:dTDP-4-dehydrorhamnose reductase